MVHVDILVVLVAAEALLVLLGLSGFLWFRGRRLAQALASARKTPAVYHQVTPPAVSTYASFLAAELARAEQLAGDDGASGEGPHIARVGNAEALLGVRRKFIENELAAQEVADDIGKYRERLVQGLQAVDLAPAPRDLAEVSKLSRRYDEELNRLRAVIGNQRDIMRELESLVAANTSTDETAQAARQQLELWERQATELERCIGVLELENKRLRTEQPQIAASAAEAPHKGQIGSEGEELRSLIGNQQETISQLNQLVRGLAPEAEKANRLTDIIGRIERANQELNTCVAVLEDENELLRGRVQVLESTSRPAGANDEEHVVRIRELEVELQFKDTAIAELQQQCKALENKYLVLQRKAAEAE